MKPEKGHVYLVGAGPGDPDLITVKGMKLLAAADVVVHDRLLSHELLNYCRQEATLIDVGKSPRRHKVRQEEINWILVANAKLGKLVVRLKGGDPFVFGRGMEEQITCDSQGVPCTVVPGVSSAIAGPASVGIPVTSRGVARSFAVVTGQINSDIANPEIDFGALTKIDTVIFLMGRRNLRFLIDSLIRCGKDQCTSVACIQEATLANQQAVQGNLSNIVDLVEQSELVSPMITVVGDVAQFCRSSLSQRSLDQRVLTTSKQLDHAVSAIAAENLVQA